MIGDLQELGTGVLEYMTENINAYALWGRFGKIRVETAPRQRLLGLSRAALDRVVLASRVKEESIERRA